MGEIQVHALRGVTFDISRGEFVAIMGPSGSGKTTLMNLLGCLDTPTGGEYVLDGIPIEQLDKNELAAVRNRKIGFIFQMFNLLSRSTALDNVQLPLVYDGRHSRQERRERAECALEVGRSRRPDGAPPTRAFGGSAATCRYCSRSSNGACPPPRRRADR